MKIERGEIWWVSLDPAIGREIKNRRPCVVLSANEVNSIRATPVVVPLSASPQAAAPIPQPQVQGEEGYIDINVSQMRKVIARRLSESKFGAPHFYLTMEITMDKAIEARTQMN